MDEVLKEKIIVHAQSVIESVLTQMGEDAKGISWFSSAAHKYPKNLQTGTGDG